MLKNNYRKNRISALIHRELPFVLQQYIADPRLNHLTITTVELSRKLDYADINITRLDEAGDNEAAVDLLRKASGRIRHGLAQRLTHFRHIPKLRFHYDDFLVESAGLHTLITQAMD